VQASPAHALGAFANLKRADDLILSVNLPNVAAHWLEFKKRILENAIARAVQTLRQDNNFSQAFFREAKIFLPRAKARKHSLTYELLSAPNAAAWRAHLGEKSMRALKKKRFFYALLSALPLGRAKSLRKKRDDYLRKIKRHPLNACDPKG
jgi:hypothetical protein